MNQPLSYAGVLLQRASQKSVLLTDQLTILIVPFSTLALWAAGAKMTATVQETLALGVALTVLVVVVLRLVAASYFVWKNDQYEMRKLRSELDDPQRQVEASLKSYVTERRKLLSEKLGHLSALANYKTDRLDSMGQTPKSLITLSIEIDSLINQLSYNVAVRVASIRLKEYCTKLISNEATDRERLWQQRKLTFSLLHCEDRISETMTLVDIHMLTEKDEESSGRDPFVEIKAMIRKLGDKYYEPEATSALRNAARKKAEGD